MLSIHNLAYQGEVNTGWLAHFGERGNAFALDGRCNPFAGGLRLAHAVVVVSESFAAREWPNDPAVGQQLTIGADSVSRAVVGVVGDVVARKIGDNSQASQLYIPLSQSGRTQSALVIRVDGEPLRLVPAVRAAIKRLDPDLPLANVSTMDQVIRNRMFEGRVYGVMFAVFGAAALLLACIGLYGVMSYTATQRTQEVGVRMALGATRGDVVRLLLGSGARLLALGLGIGLPAAIGLAQLLRGWLFGISATDPVTLLGIPAMLAAVALLASYIPARRTARVDPVIAMRND